MAHLVLYREWRPLVFDEVVEQKPVVYALRQSVISGQIAHAYLFSGTRGTGKTTMAKIFARAINCLQPQAGNPCNQCAHCRGILDGTLMDVVEMDAASNNSVDNIRRICDEVIFMPAQTRYKVYIIDEVHMLSTGAFNALLKTLEEPPAHAVFILATTEPHRIPATILSRCQRYEFRRLTLESITARLTEIAAAAEIDILPDALLTIATLADGAMRDAISLLDQARSAYPGRISRDDILALTGVVRDAFLQETATALLEGNAAALIRLVDQLVFSGRDLPRFVTDLAQHCRDLLVLRLNGDPRLLAHLSADTLQAMRRMTHSVTSEQLIAAVRALSALVSDLRWASDPRCVLEIGLIRLAGELGGTKALDVAPAPAQETQPAAEAPVELAEPAAPAQSKCEPPPAPVQSEPLEVHDQSEPPAKAQPAVSETAPAPAAEQAAVAEQGTTIADELWRHIQDQLLADGQMTVYLFSKAAVPLICDQSLQLSFKPEDIGSYEETARPSAMKPLRTAAVACGWTHEIRVVLQETAREACQTQAPLSWMDQLRAKARDLDIPVVTKEKDKNG